MNFTVIENTEKSKEEFGFAYGAEDKIITQEQLSALLAGKCLASDIQGGEYSVFVSLDANAIIPVKHGHWVEPNDTYSVTGICSCCGWVSHLYEDDVYGMPYCPNCGARMEM